MSTKFWDFCPLPSLLTVLVPASLPPPSYPLGITQSSQPSDGYHISTAPYIRCQNTSGAWQEQLSTNIIKVASDIFSWTALTRDLPPTRPYCQNCNIHARA